MPPPELSGELPSAPFQAIDNYYPGPEQEHLREAPSPASSHSNAKTCKHQAPTPETGRSF